MPTSPSLAVQTTNTYDLKTMHYDSSPTHLPWPLFKTPNDTRMNPAITFKLTPFDPLLPFPFARQNNWDTLVFAIQGLPKTKLCTNVYHSIQLYVTTHAWIIHLIYTLFYNLSSQVIAFKFYIPSNILMTTLD